MRSSVLFRYVRPRAGPRLALSAASIAENSASGTTIGVAVPVNASNPGPVSIVSQTLANAIAMTGDGISFAVGAAGGPTGTINYEAITSFAVTFEYTDDNGTYQFIRSFAINDVADGPTIAGATTDLETMIGAPQVGVETSGDLDDLFVSPTSQTLTYAVSHGSVVGSAWTWTPSTDGATTVSVTATDEDGQELTVEFTVDVAAAPAVNNAPTAGNVTLEFLVPPPAVGAPDAFTAGQWSVADDGTNGDATITITTLPADNGSAITDLEYRLNGGSAASLGGTATGAYGISGLSDGTATNVQVRAVNTNGSGAWSDVKSVTATGVPAAFTAGMWTLTDLTTGGDARISISSLPASNGSALTDLEVKIGAGAWTSLGGTATGDYDLTDDFTDGVSTNVLIRAVNANGNGGDSDTKSVTTTAASGITGHDTVHRVESTTTAGSYNFTLPGITSGQIIHLPVKVLSDNNIQTPNSWTVTLNGVAATPVIWCANASSGVFPTIGVFRVQANATGDLALAITPSGACRACSVDARYLNGVNTTTPVVGTPTAPSSFNSDVNTLNSPSSYAPQAAGNVILTDITIKGGDITGLVATSGADGHVTDATGANATSDTTDGAAYNVAPDTSAITVDWDWTGADRVASVNVEYQPA